MPQVVLVQPRIPQNVGAIGRVCAAAGAGLHVVRPIPFVLNDRSLERSGMDYLELLSLTIHDDWESFLRSTGTPRRWILSTKGTRSLYEAPIAASDYLVFGSESDGLPKSIMEAAPEESILRIPMPEPRARCLNLATAVAITVFEVLRRNGRV